MINPIHPNIDHRLVNIVRIVARKFSIGGFTFVQGCLTFQNLTKTPLIYSATYFNLGVLELCCEGLSPSQLTS